MKTSTVLWLLGLVGLAGVAVYYYERQIALLQQLTYNIISISIQNATQQLATVNLVIRISSQSRLDATVKGLYVDVYFNGQKLGSVTSNQGFVIPAMGYSDAPLQVNISPELLVGDLAGLLMGLTAAQNIGINLVGYVQIQETFLKITVPFNYNVPMSQILP